MFERKEDKNLSHNNGPVRSDVSKPVDYSVGGVVKDIRASADMKGVDSGNGGFRPATIGDLNEESKKVIPEVKSKWDSGANFGIRKSLENDFGVDGKRIGYDDGVVTLDGKRLMDASNNVDGTTYTYSQEDVTRALSDYGIDNQVVAVRDYATSSGKAVNIDWNPQDKTVSVNGRTVRPDYIIDGKAYVSKSVMDDILNRSAIGESRQDVYDGVVEKYGSGVDDLYNNYVNAPAFHYDPEEDEEYQAYLEMAGRAIEDEYKANMAASRFRTGGVGSTGQMLTASAIREGAVDNLASARSAYEQRAYERWLDEQEAARDKFTLAYNRMMDEYGIKDSINSGMKDDFYNSSEFDNNMIRDDYALNVEKNTSNLSDITYGLESEYLPGSYAAESSILQDEVATSAMDRWIYETFGPILAQNEARRDEIETQLANLGLEDAELQSELYQEYGRLETEAAVISQYLNNGAMYMTYPGIEAYIPPEYLPEMPEAEAEVTMSKVSGGNADFGGYIPMVVNGQTIMVPREIYYNQLGIPTGADEEVADETAEGAAEEVAEEVDDTAVEAVEVNNGMPATVEERQRVYESYMHMINSGLSDEQVSKILGVTKWW